MYLSECINNPLPALLKIAGEGIGIPLTEHSIESIQDLLKLGGVVAESSKEVLDVLALFCESYNLTEIVSENNLYYFRKVNGS